MLSLHAIYHYRIATILPRNEEMSFEDLSERCGLNVVNLKRILRHAMAHHRMFREPRKGIVAHTAGSRNLAENEPMREWIGLTVAETWQSSSRVRCHHPGKPYTYG